MTLRNLIKKTGYYQKIRIVNYYPMVTPIFTGDVQDIPKRFLNNTVMFIYVTSNSECKVPILTVDVVGDYK